MNGFKGTLGMIAAVVVALVIGAAGYYAWRWYQKDRALVTDLRQARADSLIAVLKRAQAAADARQAAERDSLKRDVARANASAREANAAHAGTLEQLTAARLQADSLRAAADSARARGDTVAAARLAEAATTTGSISLDSAIALVTAQHAKDQAATTDAHQATDRCTGLLRDCERGRIRADSIATFYRTKYEIEHARELPRWQRWSIEVGKALAVAWVTKQIVR